MYMCVLDAQKKKWKTIIKLIKLVFISRWGGGRREIGRAEEERTGLGDILNYQRGYLALLILFFKKQLEFIQVLLKQSIFKLK